MHPDANLGLQPLVVQGEAGCGAEPTLEIRRVRVVGDDGDGLTITHERRGDRCTVRERVRQLATVASA